MNKRNNLSDMMDKRTPLARREAVEPVNMYTSPQVDKPTSGDVAIPTNGQEHTPTSGQVGKTTRPLVRKYTTHLSPATIKAIKQTAFERERKDYEIVQEALDAYFGS